MPAELVTIPNVPILETGDYLLSTGPRTFAEEDLRAAVAALNDPAVKVPRVKIDGLSDSFDPTAHGGEPAFGRAMNLTVSDDGQTLYADLEVPQWLADSIDWAYPARSIEGAQGVLTTTGNRHDLVITAVALLGVDLPGVSTLDDLAELLQNGPEIAAANDSRLVLARMPAGGSRIVAGLDQDLVRRRFYEWIESGDAELPEGTTAWDMWVRSLRFDDSGSAYLKVEDDANGRLYRVDFTVSGSDVTFATFQEVVEQDVPVAAGAPSAVRTVALWASRDISRRVVASEPNGGTDPMTDEQRRALAAALGLDPETATEAQVHEAAATRAEAQPPEPGGDPAEPAEPAEPGEPAEPAEPAEQTPEAIAAARARVPAGMRLVDEATLAELQAGAADGRTARTEQLNAERDRIIAAALGEGRFPPSRRAHYETAWASDPEGTRTLLTASAEDGGLAPGLVPVSERGVEPTSESTATPDAEHEAYMARHFPQAHAARQRRSGTITTRTEV